MVQVTQVDRGVFVDYGRDQPGDVLQRFENIAWCDYRLGGELVIAPIDFEPLKPGRYRLRPQEVKK